MGSGEYRARIGGEGEGGSGTEDEDEATMTVTIALDEQHHFYGPDARNSAESPVAAVEQDDPHLAAFLQIAAPPSPSELLANWQQHRRHPVALHQIPAKLANQLELRLNPPACGSMRNWEFLAAHLGLSLEEIVGMRRSENPMGLLLRKFAREPLPKLLDLIGQSGRVDILLSLVPFSHKELLAPQRSQVPAAPSHQSDSAILSSSASSSFSSLAINAGPSRYPPTGPFLLILHHERPENIDLKRFHRMMMKNLERYGDENGVKVMDVNACIAEEDLFGSAQRHFERAQQVLMALSADYVDLIAITASASSNEEMQMDQRVQLKMHLHQMTFQEVLYNRGENRRFRVILMRGCPQEHVPRGWPSNTLHYRFPEDFANLCERIFDQQQAGTTAAKPTANDG